MPFDQGMFSFGVHTILSIFTEGFSWGSALLSVVKDASLLPLSAVLVPTCRVVLHMLVPLLAVHTAALLVCHWLTPVLAGSRLAVCWLLCMLATATCGHGMVSNELCCLFWGCCIQ